MKKQNTKISQNNTILLSAGGTGGHLFPAEALAVEFISRDNKVIFATDARGEKFYNKSSLKNDKNVKMHVLPSATWGSGIIGKLSAMITMALGIIKAMILLKKNKVNAVVGFGGYPSFPAVYAAQILGVPTILHEQNAILGKANIRLAIKANHIAVPLPNTKGVEKYKDKTTVTGNPVRGDILNKHKASPVALTENGEFNIFIMGGSQGAKIFGDIIPQALELLPQHLQKRINLNMQCRAEQIEEVKTKLDAIGISVNIRSFFTDVADRLEQCHLFIGRSGASTVADVTVIGRPAIFVPMQHADQQQKLNADVIADIGGAWVIT